MVNERLNLIERLQSSQTNLELWTTIDVSVLRGHFFMDPSTTTVTLRKVPSCTDIESDFKNLASTPNTQEP